jgi:hypothetical protein
VRMPRLTAGYAIRPALGLYQAAPPGSHFATPAAGATLTSMACREDEIECPDGSNNCCTANQDCIYRDGKYYCQDRPATPPPSPVRDSSVQVGG